MTDCTWPRCECPERDTCRKAKPADYAELLARLEKSGALLLTDPPKPDLLLQAAAAIRSLIGERDDAFRKGHDSRSDQVGILIARAEAAEARAALARKGEG